MRYEVVRSRLLLSTLIAAVALASGCATRAPLSASEPGSPESPKLTRFTYFEEGTVAFVGVDVRAAELMKPGARELLPIGIGLANNGNDEITFSRESFTLETEDGARYPLVSHSEYLERYNQSRSDIQLAENLFEVLQTRYVNYNSTRWRLYPYKGEPSTVADRVTLGRRYWTAGFIYFPMPEGGAQGKSYNLLVESPDIEETLVVSFRID